MVYLKNFMETPTPQSEPLSNMVPNSAGGYTYDVSDMSLLRRFLILGSEGGSYYADQRKLTKQNAEAVKRCIENNGMATVQEIVDISTARRPPKVGPPLFALAMAASYGNDKTRKFALQSLAAVATTGSHLQMFVDYVGTMRGWGRGLRTAIGDWYYSRDIKWATYQAVKYRQRYNWTHRDLLRKAHPKNPDNLGLWNELFAWITHGTLPADTETLGLIHAYEEAKTADVPRLIELIGQHRLSWEMVPTEKLDDKGVWKTLAQDMPITALIRNLATLTRVGAVTPMDAGWLVNALFHKMTANQRAIHPINVLSALVTYRSGKSVRGSHTWDPILRISSALDEALYRSFGQAPQTNQRLYMGVDISGSMGIGQVAGVYGLTPRMAASAMAMAIVHREPNYYIAGFSTTAERSSNQSHSNVMTPLDITATDNLHDAMAKTQALPFGGTDCSLPMLDALEKKMPVDCSVILIMVELSLHRGLSPRLPTGRLV